MLAQAGEHMGRGWAFGVNEALDQLGAMIGPLAVAAALAWRQHFQVAFALLAVPAVITTDRVVRRPLARCTLGGLGGPDAGPEMTGERRETAVRRLCRLSGIRADPG
jgi:hypothetical protein